MAKRPMTTVRKIELLEERVFFSADALGLAVVAEDAQRVDGGAEAADSPLLQDSPLMDDGFAAHPLESTGPLDPLLPFPWEGQDADLSGTCPVAMETRFAGDLHLTGLSPVALDAPLVVDGQCVLNGTGIIDGAVINSGLVSPGNSPGIIEQTFYTQGSDGSLQIEIGGLTAGPGAAEVNDGYDQLRVTGLASLAGKLDVSLLDGFTPEAGQTFDIITYGSATGAFESASGLFGFGDGDLYFDIVQDDTKLQLVVREAGGDGLKVQSTDQAFNDGLGMYYNYDYFQGSSLFHVGNPPGNRNGRTTFGWG